VAVGVDDDLLAGYASPSFTAKQRFLAAARRLVRLPRPGEGPLDHLVWESRWQELEAARPDPEGWCTALSQATGIYFFPAREWPERFLRYLALLGVRRVLEAGAGRGYLAAALGPLAAGRGLDFLAVDKGEGEFQADLPRHPSVVLADAFAAARTFAAEAVLWAWPAPQQSLAPLFACPAVRYLFVVGEAGGGVTGSREDWLMLPHRRSRSLSRYGRGRSGPARHQVTVFGRPR
jgi:hypothetical protein